MARKGPGRQHKGTHHEFVAAHGSLADLVSRCTNGRRLRRSCPRSSVTLTASSSSSAAGTGPAGARLQPPFRPNRSVWWTTASGYWPRRVTVDPAEPLTAAAGLRPRCKGSAVTVSDYGSPRAAAFSQRALRESAYDAHTVRRALSRRSCCVALRARAARKLRSGQATSSDWPQLLRSRSVCFRNVSDAARSTIQRAKPNRPHRAGMNGSIISGRAALISARGYGVAVARRIPNPKVGGSNPSTLIFFPHASGV